MSLNIDMNKIKNKVKNNLNPVNWLEKIKEMPLTNKMYYSKVLVGIVTGIIFGVTNFRNWPAGLTLLGVFLLTSSVWFLIYRNKNTGLKTKSFYTSAIFQFFIVTIAVWTLILNLLYIPETNWVYDF
ncbi:MAG: hypothetical protein K9W45_10835 [Candidatus Heimdallarchaeum aukensis]|uniref:Uncharacterized protein n=1 Tax=Candidatus Heimdallarchaeum aukensis TaxID=2876573 RepID=A0A9Y1BJR0_9ARCH|nr:MAG: hypothetical protein K9W45_10835 [Candidatus Heimdallarchaeum aukensis]